MMATALYRLTPSLPGLFRAIQILNSAALAAILFRWIPAYFDADGVLWSVIPRIQNVSGIMHVQLTGRPDNQKMIANTGIITASTATRLSAALFFEACSSESFSSDK